jgi:type II secretory pathway pseudopilin PulG
MKRSLHRLPPRRRSRPAYTLIEMIACVSTASVLTAGMGSAVFLSSQAFNARDTPAARRIDAALVQRQILDDLRYASSISERSANAVTFVVPDRTGDGFPDTLRYAWSGAGTPLTFAINAGATRVLIPSVENFSLDFQTRKLNATVQPTN